MSPSLDKLLNDFALRSLRETADKDYVHARLAYRYRLIPQFFWSSLHSLEKYTKCVLLLNRIDATKVKHEVSLGLAKLNESGRFSIDLSTQAAEFVAKLEGGARFRYYESSYYSEEDDLPQLDRTVWELRRYCQPLDYDSEVEGHRVNQLSANLKRIRDAMDSQHKGSCITGGWLESIMDNRTHTARKALTWKNLFFGCNNRKTVQLECYLEAGNSPLFLHPEIVDEVAKYVHLPKEVKSAYGHLHADRVAGKSVAK